MAKLPIPFPNPKTYRGHSGVDYGQPRGTAFPASGPGVVKTLSRNDAGGFYIWVQYDNGPLVGYHHMDSHKGCPKVGTRVTEGTRLGYVGNTGNSTGPHLHSEVSGHRTTDGYWKFFDRTRVVGTRPAGDTITPITEKRSPMTTLFYVAPHNNTRAKGKAGWALAGDAGDPTSPANWIETTDPDFGRALEAKHGPRVEVGPGGWDSFARDYRRGGAAPVGNVTVDVDYQKLVDTFLNTQAARLKS